MRSVAILSLVAIAMAFEAPPPVPNQVGAILGIFAMCGNDPIDCGEGWCCLNGQQCVTDPTGHIMCYDPGLSKDNNEPITVDPAFFGTTYSYQATPSHASNYATQTAGYGGSTIVVAASGASSAASAASAASIAAGGGSTTYAASSSEQTVYGNPGGKPSNSTHGATNVSSSGAIVMSNNGSPATTSSNLQISIVTLIGFFIVTLTYL